MMNNIYGFDIEAVPLSIFNPDAKLLCASITQDFTVTWVRDHYQRNLIDELTNLTSLAVIGTILKDPKNTICAHNEPFDHIGWERFFIEHNPNDRAIQCNIFCSMTANALVNPRDERNSLVSVSDKYLGLPKLDIDPKHITESPVEQLILYNAHDSMLHYLLYEPLMNEIVDKKLETLFSYLMKAMKILINMSIRGAKLDLNYIKKHRSEVEEKIEEVYNKLIKVFGEINFRSSQQLSKVLFDELELPILDYTPKGSPSTGVDSIAKLKNLKNIPKEQKDSLQLLLDYRRLSKINSTYLGPLQHKHLGFDNRIHTQYFLGKGWDNRFGTYGTVSGRSSSANPNLQNQPNTVTVDGFTINIRRCFIPGQNYHITKADYSQLEMRVAAFLSKDSNMLNVFRKGIDIHTFSLSGVYEENYDYIVEQLKKEDKVWKERRRFIKNFNFALIYGGSPFKLQMLLLKELELWMEIEEVRRIIKMWGKLYPKFIEWKYLIYNLIYELGYVRTETGRERYFFESGEGKIYDKKTMSKFYREGLNDLIQSFASDICLLGLTCLSDLINDYKIDGYPLFLVHDSIDGEYHTNYNMEKIYRKAMVNMPKNILEKEFGLDLDNLHLEIEVKDNLEHWS